MLTLIITGLICSFCSFAIGVKAGKRRKLIPATIPIANLIDDFEEFARLSEGGELSVEANAALKALHDHAKQKLLPPAAKKKKPNTWEGSDRKKEWCDMLCFEAELGKASSDDERITVITRWMKKYYFTTAHGWQTWCIKQMTAASSRDKLRNLFDNQEQ